MGAEEQRIELLKGMNQYIIDFGDEELYNEWFRCGVPDEATEDDYEFIAGDTEEWAYVCQLFGRLIRDYECYE